MPSAVLNESVKSPALARALYFKKCYRWKRHHRSKLERVIVGNCCFCQTKAGLFKNVHDKCLRDAEVARSQLRQLAADAITSGKTAEDIAQQLSSIKLSGRLTDGDARSELLTSADEATQKFALMSPISNEEAERIGDIFKSIDERWFDEPTKMVNWSGFLTLLHSNTLYQVLHGEIPYTNPDAFAGFRFAQGEVPIIKRNAVLAEYKAISTGSTYHSVSVPIGGGMYYRVGASQPRTQQSGLVPVAEGQILITTQAINFTSHNVNFRLPYSSIMRLESFVDAVGIYENHGRSKVIIPGTIGFIDEGWYFYNLISALMTWK